MARRRRPGNNDWQFAGLAATAHILRIEHPAIETAAVVFSIEDSKETTLTWKPNFKAAPGTPR